MVENTLSTYPPLVFAGEVRQLTARLAQVANGKAFLLQGGDCAESFGEFRADTIRDTFRILLQMTSILMLEAKLPIVKIGRLAGQFAKPRSNDLETRDGVSLPSYRGDIINGFDFTPEARIPDPARMERAYVQSAATMNLLRAFASGGYGDLHRVHTWNLDFVKNSPQNNHYEQIANRMDEILAFLGACGIDADNSPQIHEVEFYTSHEALLLHYEQALTRRDSTTAENSTKYEGDWYSCSGHFLWIGDRTRQVDGAHVEYMRGIKNPIGIKCGPSLNLDDLKKLLEILNPDNTPGRITLISRMGHEKVEKHLPLLIKEVKKMGQTVVWCCDPMHGNTQTAINGFKTRDFKHVLSEVQKFFQISRSEGAHPGGVHFELTGKNVVECLGGDQKIVAENLAQGKYETLCDPRLNASQALELAFQLCK